MFVTFFLGLFDPSQNKLVYVNAGHLQPLIMRPSEPAQTLGEAIHTPLGIFETPFVTTEVIIEPKTSILVVTDGITEAANTDGQFFEMERLAKVMTDSQASLAGELIKSATSSVTDFRQTMA